jgi:glycerol-3-phosphate dehydrogenase
MIPAVELVVVGGGVNGCAVARDAALRGISTVLLERNDFGCGTSAWCSRLVHGGLKYLETGEVGLVRESLRERSVLLHTAPHLVKPYRMAIPLYRTGRRSPVKVEAGMALYDLLSARKTLPRHQVLGPAAASRLLPGLDPVGLRGVVVYHDAQVAWPERLCVELALAARRFGATVRNHAEVTALEAGPRGTVEVTYRVGGAAERVRAYRVVNATGAWLDHTLGGWDAAGTAGPLVRASRGTHLVVGPFAGAPEVGLFFEHPVDGRPMLVLPWAGRYLLGSTDLFDDRLPDEVVASDEEVRYILDAVNRVLPGAGMTVADVLGRYVGLRPLPADGARSPGAVSRDFRFVEHPTLPLVSVIGGKLTTHRRLAERLLDRLFPATRRRTATSRVPLPGARGEGAGSLMTDPDGFARTVAALAGWPAHVGRRLVGIYGAAAISLARRAVAEDLAALVEPAVGVPEVELVHVVEVEAAASTADVVLRRTMWAWEAPTVDIEGLESIGTFLSDRYRWDRVSDRAMLDASLRSLGLTPAGAERAAARVGVG